MAADVRPVILLAFANEQEDSANYLRNLPEERRRLLAVLDRESTPYAVAQYPNLTIEELVAGLQRYSNRIVVLHYGGHSDNSYLLLESAASKSEFAHAGGLAKLLAQQHGLQLVFLNGCFNSRQADLLLDAGIPVVVATNAEIEDAAALAFASCFYQALATNATIQSAFQLAAGAVELQQGQLDSQTLPWELCYRDQAAADWRLADAIDDPCWGLPPLPRQPLPDRPFRGLDWYRRQDADLFFGRCAEIHNLLGRVDDVQGAPVILLYGQSGVGKSSLLDAGLIPRLEGNAHCIYLRRSADKAIVLALRHALGAPGASQSVSDAWLACEAHHQLPVLVILDQVEEIFAQPHNASAPASELDDLLKSMQSLFGDEAKQRPRGKLLLGFRKEYLAEIETSLVERTQTHVKVFVEPLGRRGVIEAITGVARTPYLHQQYGLTVEDGLAAQIADDLLEDTESPLAPTLQVLLTKLWEQASARNRAQPTFDVMLYRQMKRDGLALTDFLTRQLQFVQALNPTAVGSGLALDLLYFYTTAAPSAAQRTIAELQESYRNQPRPFLAALLQQCKDAYLLVETAQDQATSTSARLAHDALAALVRERFVRSDAPGQRARRALENRAVEWENGDNGALFDDRDLVLVEQGQLGMRARTPDEERLFQASQRARRRRQRTRLGLGMAALLALLLFLAYAGIVSLRDQAQNDNVARQESQWLADLSLQQLLVNPALSVALAWRALPGPGQPKPYVARAEFALTEALRSGLQRQVRQVAQPPLTEDQVALGDEYIAVGGDALRLLSYDLGEVITLTEGAATSYVVAWDTTGQTLLSRAGDTVEVWSQKRRVASQQFRNPLACAAWRPNTDQIVVCSGKALRLWDNTAQTLTSIADFPGLALAAQWSPAGQQLAAWDAAPTDNDTQTLVIWDAQAGQVVQHLPSAPAQRIRAAAWSPDGQRLLLVRNDSTMLLWNAATPASQAVLSNRNPLTGATFVDDARFLTWGDQDGVRLWSVDNSAPVRQFGGAADLIQGVELSPDRQRVLLFLQSGQVDEYDLASGERTATRAGHSKRVQAAAWSGDYLATSSLDGTVRIWDANSDLPASITLFGHQTAAPGRADVLGARWLPDRTILTYGLDGTFRTWEVLDERGLPLCNGNDQDGYPRCQLYSRALADHAGEIVSARWLDDNTLLTVDGDSTARRISLASGEIQAVPNDTATYPDVLWSPDGHKVLSYVPSTYLIEGDDPDGAVYNVADGTQVATIPGPIAHAIWLQAGVIVSQEDGATQIVDPGTGTSMLTLSGITSTVMAAQSYADRILALGDGGGSVHIWDLAAGQWVTSFPAQQPGTLAWPVHDLQWSADGKLLLASSNNVALWNAANGALQWATGTQSLDDAYAALSPDGRFVAVSSNTGYSVLDAASGAVLWENKAAHADTVNGLAWLIGDTWPDQDRYGPLLGRIADWVNGVQRSHDSNRLLLITWSGDGTTKLWDWSERTEIMRLAQPAIVTQSAISPDGRQILTGGMSESGESAMLRVWQAWRQTANLPQENSDKE